MNEYYQILGLNSGASRQAIKKAYRKLAFEFHPDRNPAPDAKEKFILIAEAYEMLIGERKPKRSNYATQTPTYEQRRSAAQARARQQSQMRYEAFKRNNRVFQRSWFYYPAKALAYAVYGAMLMIAGLFWLIPLILAIRGEYFMALFILPFSFASLSLFPAAKKYLKEIQPYFQEY